MVARQFEGVNLIIANTDAQALACSSCPTKIQLGKSITYGLGAGAVPEKGKEAAEASISDIVDKLKGTHMLFLTAGMGGGTGTGAAPVIARAAKDQGILTVALVTKPFAFEGNKRMVLAEAGIKELEKSVDTMIVIPNQELFKFIQSFANSFHMVNNVLYDSVKGMTDLIINPGLINVDFADVCTIMRDKGRALMGSGLAEGKERAKNAAQAAMTNPLLEGIDMSKATGVLINIAGGQDLSLAEVNEVASIVKDSVAVDANIIFGASLDDELEGKMRVSLIVTVPKKAIPSSTSESVKYWFNRLY